MKKLIQEAHGNALRHGFWEGNRSFPEIIALLHSEISEALEEYRKGHKENEVYYNHQAFGAVRPEGIPIELADCVIRILDLCGHYDINLETAIALKMAYNLTRPYKHGKVL